MDTKNPSTNLPLYSVFELSAALKHKVEDGFQHIRVKGELGRVTRARSGHIYVDMKDDKAVLSCVVWRGVSSGLRFQPEEGMEVVAEGRLTTYPGRSQYQMVIESLDLAGTGALMKLLEERKQKLAREGLFDTEKKKDLPFLPKTIGVITSPTGAVIRDILHRLEDRFPCHVLLWPVLVQGERAASEVTEALQGFHALKKGGGIPLPDVIIIARGGGSFEDLWPFHDERLVRSVAESKFPVISAIGHETDWTLLDLVADRRAPTPTAAAEMAVPVRHDLSRRLEDLKARLTTALIRVSDRQKLQLKAARLPRPEDILSAAYQRCDGLCERFDRAFVHHAHIQGLRLKNIGGRLTPYVIEQTCQKYQQALGHLQNRFQNALQRNLEARHARLQTEGSLLEALSHKKILERGFTLTKDPHGRVIRHAKGMKPGHAVHLVFHDGERSAVITAETGTKTIPDQPKGKPSGEKTSLKTSDQGSLF